MRPLADILAGLPATVQERQYARSWPLLPLSVAVLSLFWLLSAAIAVVSYQAAVEVLSSRGMGGGLAAVAVSLGIIADTVLGLMVLIRRMARLACLGMVAVSVAYLLFGSLLTPDIWADPLGPYVKVLPGIVLALATWVWLEDR